MIIALWLTTIFVFLISALALIMYFVSDHNKSDSVQILVNGIKEGLRGCGFKLKTNTYPVELYKCVIVTEGEICEECLIKTTRPPMDIADWLKEGLPNTPSPTNACKGECPCELVLVKTIHQVTHDH